ncbi:hypothetical protein [Nitrosomonas sp. Is37]|uniref:hypothetical protein n=1 Tax=Nitrosomonas sp. Is37 TaxID=3080535 RepID=UPI00294B6EB0|nr:hypothetical protein [Nitrosomonas sp. Is37]MDV6343328.1 hypothetical protein [Nitrosomonas sp. Is37]
MEIKVSSRILPLSNYIDAADVADVKKAADYFPDIPLVNEGGKDVRFFYDNQLNSNKPCHT